MVPGYPATVNPLHTCINACRRNPAPYCRDVRPRSAQVATDSRRVAQAPARFFACLMSGCMTHASATHVQRPDRPVLTNSTMQSRHRTPGLCSPAAKLQDQSLLQPSLESNSGSHDDRPATTLTGIRALIHCNRSDDSHKLSNSGNHGNHNDRTNAVRPSQPRGDSEFTAISQPVRKIPHFRSGARKINVTRELSDVTSMHPAGKYHP